MTSWINCCNSIQENRHYRQISKNHLFTVVPTSSISASNLTQQTFQCRNWSCTIDFQLFTGKPQDSVPLEQHHYTHKNKVNKYVFMFLFRVQSNSPSQDIWNTWLMDNWGSWLKEEKKITSEYWLLQKG